MKILIEESVLRQALDALDELREEIRAMRRQDHAPYHYTSDVLRTALEAAENVEMLERELTATQHVVAQYAEGERKLRDELAALREQIDELEYNLRWR